MGTPLSTFKVILEAVAYEDASDVYEVAELFVGGLERGQMLLAEVGVEVARLDARELGDVVDHLLLGRDVVVDEGTALARTGPTDAGDAGNGHLGRLDG